MNFFEFRGLKFMEYISGMVTGRLSDFSRGLLVLQGFLTVYFLTRFSEFVNFIWFICHAFCEQYVCLYNSCRIEFLYKFHDLFWIFLSAICEIYQWFDNRVII